jgi:diacylglycerol kinase (ATP)
VWAIVINPVSGGGKGATLGREVAGYFAKLGAEYTIITATSAAKLKVNLQNFLDLPEGQACEGVVAVGGDGLAHLVLQIVAPRRIPFTIG